MAAALPPTLKTAGLAPFATRAAQLEKYRPIVWYWLEYHILQKILNTQLHLGDDETQTYAINLMDTLEAFKTANSANDAITDDVAAKAYIENFALETFTRGDDAQRTGKVTRQTADTFQAAATFIDLLGIWGQLDGEWVARARYAKFHAVRIARAIKAGEDPNATNPVVEEELPAAAKPVDEDNVDAELRALEREQSGYRPPTVEDAPPSALPSRPESTRLEHPPRTFSASSPEAAARHIKIEPTDPGAHHDDVSPIEPADRHGSIGGGYFPSVPSTDTGDTLMHDANGHSVPPAVPSLQHQDTSEEADTDFYSSHSQTPGLQRDNQPPSDHYQQTPSLPTPASTSGPPPDHFSQVQGQPPTAPSPAAFYSDEGKKPAPYAQPPASTVAPAWQIANAPPPQGNSGMNTNGPPPGGYNTDDEAVLKAQKHAKWAISALNFEDVDTAVKELRGALRVLGAG